MTRDIWKEPPSGNEGDAAKDFEPAKEEASRSEEAAAEAEEPREYEPKHRAPGRAPLIRRRRSRAGDEETISWETSWREEPKEPARSRWTDEEEPSITPPPRPIEEVPYLGPRRSEQKKRRSRPADPPESEPSARSREYTGRHLAPKKARWGRGLEEQLSEGEDQGAAEVEDPAIAEGDVERGVIDETASHEAPSHEAPSDEARLDEAPPDEAAPHDGSPVEVERGAARVETEPAATSTAAVATSSPAPVAGAAAPTGEASGGREVEHGSEVEHRPAEPPSAVTAAPVPVPVPPAPAAAAPDAPAAEEPEQNQDEASAAVAEETGRGAASASAPDAEEEAELSDVEEEFEGSDLDDEYEDAPAGPRRAALQQRKKKKRVLQGGVAALAIVAAIAGVVGAGFLVKEAVEEPRQRAAVPFDRPEDERIDGTTLVFGTKESADPSRGALWMVLLTVDPETEEASIVYIPAHTAVEVPGRGLQGVGESYGSGGVPLLLVSAENLLGIKIDRYLELSDKDALVLFEQLETLTVDVPAEVRVPVGRDQARLIFVEGPQQMTPSSLVRLLYTIGIDGDDVELGSRHLAFWDQLLDEYDDPSHLAAAFEAAGAALGESDASREELASFMELLAETPSEDVTITALPVRPISAGDSQLYSTDAEELAAFVDETIGTPAGAEEEVRVQLLNGNGVPGIGREAAAKLVGEGFRVILGGNARRLDYQKTLVIAYDSSDHGIALAERARELLGVGEVQVSGQQQGIVDLTIVVGKDFLRAR